MEAVIAIAVLTCISLAVLVLFKPNIEFCGKSIGIYWIVAVLGATVLIASRLISLKEVLEGLTADSSINPIKILILFLSMTTMSIFLDEVGFFRYLANAVLRKANSSQKILFLFIYLLVSVLTIFTSNDIIILTFTPFICYFAKNAKINPVPYLFGEFVAANTWSMALVIGNPTNVYLAASNHISFMKYMSVMSLPTLVGGTTAFLILYWIFRRPLSKPIKVHAEDYKIPNLGLLWIGIIHLLVCILLLVFSSYIGLELWLITLCLTVSLFTFALFYQIITKNKSRKLLRCLKRTPWELVPFVTAMFILVLALDKYGATTLLGQFFGNKNPIYKYGFASFICANFMNNIPMSVLFSSVVRTLDPAVRLQGVYATIAGSNIGAFFTPIGALAGIMWVGILKKQDVKFSFLTYIKYGFVVSLPTLTATLFILQLVMA